ncbi:Scr1 family TA system antitoxin-like transcriptional regulator, partial [Streptomyces cellulosae]
RHSGPRPAQLHPSERKRSTDSVGGPSRKIEANRDENAGMAGPFTLIETKGERRIAYVEVQNVSRVHSDRESVRALEAKYGTLRAQALTPRESVAYVEKLLGEL